MTEDAPNLRQVTIFTDGACIGNPGPGGYGTVLLYGSHRKELAAGYAETTNNRMEMMAVIRGLETLTERCDIVVHSDSAYVVNSVEKGWATRWRANGWRKGKKRNSDAKNRDLWGRLLELLEQHQVSFKWVKGHAGIPENERCDQLANDAARNSAVLSEDGFKAELPGEGDSERLALPGLGG